jgi:hypothetical protein
LNWRCWLNDRRLHTTIGDIAAIEYEASYRRHNNRRRATASGTT